MNELAAKHAHQTSRHRQSVLQSKLQPHCIWTTSQWKHTRAEHSSASGKHALKFYHRGERSNNIQDSRLPAFPDMSTVYISLLPAPLFQEHTVPPLVQDCVVNEEPRSRLLSDRSEILTDVKAPCLCCEQLIFIFQPWMRAQANPSRQQLAKVC